MIGDYEWNEEYVVAVRWGAVYHTSNETLNLFREITAELNWTPRS